eukprot:CAMPEP_0117655430 /NCGR_PEP_ID=MMETSP0804-20121206/4275_1 /TAXON_ID=1074897 /ORGANISM="Tetraselmis astigmatica, Strain CCMP880" /LENGTH=427 /DNA_ID=CAMNT_0005461781 /DNA_START=100 /DNA_END=1383 /DNA_ORIENTATION=+
MAATDLALKNCRVLDVFAGVVETDCCVLIRGGRIEEVATNGAKLSTEVGPSCMEVDLAGKVVCPGLCDAHVHATANTANLPGLLTQPESLVAVKAANILRGMLDRGFTTVRDCGGADWGLALGIEEGEVAGPRLLFTGHALSQTGGHGDMRGKGEQCFACGAALRGIGRVCDGVAEVRKAARDEIRKGAHCIKVMASGGVSSPTDRLANTQFSVEELEAIVEEAEAAGSYVCAHAYTPKAIVRALRAGVRSIEHGNFLDAECAREMATRGAFLVSTTITYHALKSEGEKAGMAPDLVQKVGDLVERGLESIQLADNHGVKMCYGSDLLGAMHCHQLKELELRRRVQEPIEILRSATVNCAELFGMQGLIGEVAPGHFADLLVLSFDPLVEFEKLYEGDNVEAVFKEGRLVKLSLVSGSPLQALRQVL